MGADQVAPAVHYKRLDWRRCRLIWRCDLVAIWAWLRWEGVPAHALQGLRGLEWDQGLI